MRKIIFGVIAVSALLLSSCNTHKAIYKFDLAEVSRFDRGNRSVGGEKITDGIKERYEAEHERILYFSDTSIAADWLMSSEAFALRLSNQNEGSIKVLWDEAVYVDAEGKSLAVMHAGVPYGKKDETQLPSILAGTSHITDIVIPKDFVYWSKNLGWMMEPELPTFVRNGVSKRLVLERAKKYIGKKVKILLPLQIGDSVKEYVFTFNIAEVKGSWE